MLNFSSFNLLFFSPCFCLFSIIWYSYFLLNFNNSAGRTNKKDFLKVKNKSLVVNYSRYSNFYFVTPIFYYFTVYLFVIKNYEGFFFFRHFFLSNFLFSFFFYTIVVLLFLYYFFFNILKAGSTSNYTLDYLLSIFHVIFFLPYSFFSSNALTIFFFLELGSNIILYNLISSSNWFSLSNSKNKLNSNATTISKYFFNTIFFHFWSSFFTSILILYSIINFYLYFGTTEWFYLNFLLDTSLSGAYSTNNVFIYLNVTIFFIAFLLKLGVSPFFVFKLEIYKGLPLYNIFFYSTSFFIIFFTTFFLVFFYYLPVIAIYLKFFITLFVFVIIFLVIFFIFDSAILRNFFAFSSLINSINLFILIV